MIFRVPAFSAFATTAFMSHGARNWPFLMLIAHPVFAAASIRSVWRESNAGIWIMSTTFAAGGGGGGGCVCGWGALRGRGRSAVARFGGGCVIWGRGGGGRRGWRENVTRLILDRVPLSLLRLVLLGAGRRLGLFRGIGGDSLVGATSTPDGIGIPGTMDGLLVPLFLPGCCRGRCRLRSGLP